MLLHSVGLHLRGHRAQDLGVGIAERDHEIAVGDADHQLAGQIARPARKHVGEQQPRRVVAVAAVVDEQALLARADGGVFHIRVGAAAQVGDRLRVHILHADAPAVEMLFVEVGDAAVLVDHIGDHQVAQEFAVGQHGQPALAHFQQHGQRLDHGVDALGQIAVGAGAAVGLDAQHRAHKGLEHHVELAGVALVGSVEGAQVGGHIRAAGAQPQLKALAVEHLDLVVDAQALLDIAGELLGAHAVRGAVPVSVGHVSVPLARIIVATLQL